MRCCHRWLGVSASPAGDLAHKEMRAPVPLQGLIRGSRLQLSLCWNTGLGTDVRHRRQFRLTMLRNS